MGRPPNDTSSKQQKTEANYYTDVSDNYVMLLGTPEAEYKENEKIIDEIWGSFTMRSGGASGGS
jgi:general stress protein 26